MESKTKKGSQWRYKAGAIMPIIVSLLIPSSWAAESADFKQAVKAYESKRYGDALMLLNKLPPAQADKPIAHYYLGLTYQALHQYDRATSEYMWNYKRQADSDLTYKSWQALTALKNMKYSRTVYASSPSPTSMRDPATWSSPAQIAAAKKDSKGWSNAGYSGEGEANRVPNWTWQRTSAGCGRH